MAQRRGQIPRPREQRRRMAASSEATILPDDPTSMLHIRAVPLQKGLEAGMGIQEAVQEAIQWIGTPTD